MSHSSSQTHPIKCECGHQYAARLWLVASPSEDEDSRTAIQEGTINRPKCPACGQTDREIPLLLFQPAELPQFVLVMPSDLGKDHQGELGQSLMQYYVATLTEAERERLSRLTVAEFSPVVISYQDLVQFVDEKGNRPRLTAVKAITNILRHTPEQFSQGDIARLARAALDLLPREENPLEWALLKGRLASSLDESNCDEAILHLKESLEVFTQADYPENWARGMADLGRLYLDRAAGKPAENLETAIACFRQSLEVLTEDVHPLLWAMNNAALSVLYSRRGAGDRSENSELALHHALQTLNVFTQQSHPEDYARSCTLIGEAYRDRLLGERYKNLSEAIAHYQKAREYYEQTKDHRKFRYTEELIGQAYLLRSGVGGGANDATEAIEFLQSALRTIDKLTDRDRWAGTAYNLALACTFQGGNQSSDIEKSIHEPQESLALRAYRQKVQAIPPDLLDPAGHLANLGNALHTRFERTGREADLDEAIRLLQQAVQVPPRESPDLAGYLANLANSLHTRFERAGGEADLDEAIRVLQQAVQATPPGSPDLGGYLTNLGNVLGDRFTRMGREADLDEAILALHQAVEATLPDSPDLPAILANWGSGLMQRFGRTGQEADLEEAIGAYQKASQATPPDSPNLPGMLNNLGYGWVTRYKRTGREADLEEAIAAHQQAVQATPRDSPQLASHLTNLGNTLHTRFGRTGQEADLEEGIGALQQAVQATPPNSPQLPGRLNNLANGLRDRFTRTGREVDLEEAIGAYQQAVQATSPDSPQLPSILTSLGNGLGVRFRFTGREADLEEAIWALKLAVRVTPSDSPDLPGHLSNLAIGLRDWSGLTGRVADLEAAVQVSRRACQVAALLEPQAALGAARNWGRWAFARKQWEETAEAYDHGLNAGRQLLAQQLHREHKESWLRDLQEMSGRAAYALAKLGRYKDAAATMEHGRARLLAEALQRNRRDLEQLPILGYGELYRRYHEILETQQQLMQQAAVQPSLPGQARLDAMAAAQVVFDQVMAEIREVPGYGDFLAEPTFSQIQPTADTFLAYLLATPAGGLALIIYSAEVQPVWLDSLTDGAVLEWLGLPSDDPAGGGWLSAYRNWLIVHTLQAQQSWFAVIDDVARRLWTQIMQPVAAAMKQRMLVEPSATPALTLVPAGLLALLPLHAAWTEDASTVTRRRYFLDEFTVNYAPSALALRYARDGGARGPADRLLAVEEPFGSNAARLPDVHAEVTAIAELFEKPVILRGAEATRRAVRSSLRNANVVHFSCHGRNNWQSPLDSGLLMADDESGKDVLLTVRELLELAHTGGRLVTLSACETGIVGTDLPDEVVALPSALLQAGFGGVAASLWSVADASSAMLMEHFYRCWRVDGLPPAQALRASQRWLRDTTNREKAEYFERYSPALCGMRMSEGVATEFFPQTMRRDLDRRGFAHPFWWAAFYLTGV